MPAFFLFFFSLILSVLYLVLHRSKYDYLIFGVMRSPHNYKPQTRCRAHEVFVVPLFCPGINSCLKQLIFIFM